MDNQQVDDLINKIRDGDAQAFSELTETYYDQIYTLLFRWFGNKEDAEDGVQEVFMKLAHSILSFNRRSSFKTWVYRVAINIAKDIYMKNKKILERNNDLPEAEYLDANEDSQRLWKAVNQLSEKFKSAVILVYSKDLNHNEAAQVLKCSETTVSWRIFQAKKRLKKALMEATS